LAIEEDLVVCLSVIALARLELTAVVVVKRLDLVH
jgi:hypothetical protein